MDYIVLDLEYGFPFQTALKHFQKWCGDDFCILSWGPDDIFILKENMQYFSISESWLPKCYDVQRTFDVQIARENRQCSMSCALDLHKELNIVKFCCPECGSEITCDELIRQKDKVYISVASCENGDEYFIRFKISKRNSGFANVSRLVYEIDEKRKLYYEEKRRQAEEKEKKYIENIFSQETSEVIL